MRTQPDLVRDLRNAKQSNDQSGFESFFRREYPTVTRIAYGVVRDRHLAEDVAQDVFVAAQPKFVGQYDTSAAAGWVRIAASHLGLNAIRGERRRADRQRRERTSTSSPDPEEMLLAAERDSEVRVALSRLPRHAATVLVLRHSGLTYAEVAQVLDVNVSQVGTMLRRAETKLRKEIERASRS